MPAVIALPPARREAATAALARGFADDPAFADLWPDPQRRARGLRGLLGVLVADGLRNGFVDAVEIQGGVVAAAVWFPPGAYPVAGWRRVRATPPMLRVAAVAPRAFPRLARLGANIDAAFPDDRPWYLAALAAVPEAQGQGHGSALLAHGLERCAGGDCYLETSTPGAARLYERHGFETLEAQARLLPGGPPHRRMRRPG